MHRHFLLYKPYGYLSQFWSDDAREARKKRFLGELHDFPPGTMAVGRLDEASEGLLVLTTDGRLSERLRRADVEKEYYIQVDGLATEAALAQLRQGIDISLHGQAFRTAPCQARRLAEAPSLPPRARPVRDERHGPSSWLSVTIAEGKFRQVRKMSAAVGLPTLRLVRVRVGPLLLGALQPGEVRELPSWDEAATALFLLTSGALFSS
ncbi:pseudouridine synthase [Hymenobacter sp. RP-2-7]|uniref:Pseudouridine synthase n=1 Tax=Hymenobacter polaris TaxID=2682546 RepID=A0A7Y0AHQ9_9BACT|nr:pseudouridine synthase [Hymenobacter polaris]NML67537.1 pseudouridine synthase [Hymenobacter polaris]